AVGRYAHRSLRRIRGAAASALGPEDLAALDELLDVDSPHSILRRDDLAVRAERTVWAARRA
ncbi:SAM-dependent methyltransferase, partial [Microbispora rosea]